MNETEIAAMALRAEKAEAEVAELREQVRVHTAIRDANSTRLQQLRDEKSPDYREIKGYLEPAIMHHVRTRYGDVSYDSRKERALRLLEEAMELAQAEGVPRATIVQLERRVASKPIGNPADELGDVGFTLLAYTGSTGSDLLAETDRRLVEGNARPVAESRARHEAKKAAGVAFDS